MLTRRFRARCRDDPHASLQVDFAPYCSDRLPAPAGTQDRKLQALGGHVILPAQGLHEGWDLAVVQGAMMLYRRHLRPGRQKMIEMAFPAPWVLTLAMPEHLRVVQHLLYASADLRRCLRLGHPNGLENRKHVLGGEFINRKTADYRVDVVPQRANPVLAGTFTPPARFVARDVGGSTFGKRRRLLAALPTQRGPLIAFALEWVYPIIKLLAALLGLLAGSLQADVRIPTEASPMTAAGNRVSKEPRPV
jgi:hypothetical protein